MGKIALGYHDRVRAATSITASDWLGSLPPANLGTVQPSQIWQTPDGINSVAVQADFGSASSISAVTLINSNMTPAGTWRVMLSNTAPALGDAYDSGIMPTGIDIVYRKMVHLMSSHILTRYLRVELIDTSISEISAGRLAALYLYKPAINYEYGMKRQFRDFSHKFEAEQGSVWILRGPLQRGVQFMLPAVVETETRGSNPPGLASLIRLSGTWNDVLVVLDEASANVGLDSFWGPLETLEDWELIHFRHSRMGFRVMDRL